MKLRKVEFTNHPILGDFVFDFLVGSKVHDFALLVAENGCGKTVFLEEVHKILSKGFQIWDDGIGRKVTMQFDELERKELDLSTDVVTINYDESESQKINYQRYSACDDRCNDITAVILQKIQNVPNGGQLNRLLKCAYSTVEINFSKKDIISVMATTVDQEEHVKNRSTPELATEIAQLLVDIKNQDNAEKAFLFDAGKSNSDAKHIGKFDRFKEAYAKMFEGKELLDTQASDGKHQVLFIDKRRGNQFDIAGLSSGEKQVVFRVGYLLRNLKGLRGGVVLIDEPELSLHPIWQEKYLQFLREVFSDDQGLGIQFIIATHSPLLLKATKYEDVSVHIFTLNDKGHIRISNAKEKGFGILKWSPTWGEICYFAYGLPTIEFHDDLYSSIEDSQKNSQVYRVSQKCFETFVCQKRPNVTKVSWQDNKSVLKEETIMTFIRNRIHHPDNTYRPEVTPTQLKDSIEAMIDLIRNP